VKTAISIPDSAFERVERHAKKLGMSRSEFLTRAAERWADELDEDELTQAIDDALANAGDDADDNVEFLREAAIRALTADEPS
jgi:antitoxin MazE6